MHLGFRNNIVMVKLFFAKDTVMVYTEELNFGVSINDYLVAYTLN